VRRFLCAEIECLSAGKRDIPVALGFGVLLTTKSMKLDGRFSVSNCESSRFHHPFQHEALSFFRCIGSLLSKYTCPQFFEVGITR
jgi:hypothetical protein